MRLPMRALSFSLVCPGICIIPESRRFTLSSISRYSRYLVFPAESRNLGTLICSPASKFQFRFVVDRSSILSFRSARVAYDCGRDALWTRGEATDERGALSRFIREDVEDRHCDMHAHITTCSAKFECCRARQCGARWTAQRSSGTTGNYRSDNGLVTDMISLYFIKIQVQY